MINQHRHSSIIKEFQQAIIVIKTTVLYYLIRIQIVLRMDERMLVNNMVGHSGQPLFRTLCFHVRVRIAQNGTRWG